MKVFVFIGCPGTEILSESEFVKDQTTFYYKESKTVS